jgi:hypothetical protein
MTIATAMGHRQPSFSVPPPQLRNISAKVQPPFQQRGPQRYSSDDDLPKEKIMPLFRSSYLRPQANSLLAAFRLPVMKVEPSSGTMGGPQLPESLQDLSQEDHHLGKVDPLGYLDAVKSRFRDRLESYDRFLDIMDDFKNNGLVFNHSCFAISSVYH